MLAQSRPIPFKAACTRQASQLDVKVSGRLLVETEKPMWRACLEHAPGADVRLDLGGVTEMDASGLGLLADFAREAGQGGRRVTVVAASLRVRRLLTLTKLDALLTDQVRNSQVAA